LVTPEDGRRGGSYNENDLGYEAFNFLPLKADCSVTSSRRSEPIFNRPLSRCGESNQAFLARR
jgi:hypothetical protein